MVDRVTAVTSAKGTALEQVTRKQGYNANGTVAWVEDANGNRTAYEYDGVDRLAKTVFPSPTTPGSTNAADYESYTYDPGGNLLTRRSRAGESFGYSYDNLNRLLVKTVPERSGLATTHTRDVYYGYEGSERKSIRARGAKQGFAALSNRLLLTGRINAASRRHSLLVRYRPKQR